MRRPTLRTRLAAAGLAEPSVAADRVESLPDLARASILEHLGEFAAAADPDVALRQVAELIDHGMPLERFEDADARRALIRLLGSSEGLADAVVRLPDASVLATQPRHPRSVDEYRDSLLQSVEGRERMAAFTALRRRYRRHLIEIAAYDLGLEDPVAACLRSQPRSVTSHPQRWRPRLPWLGARLRSASRRPMSTVSASL